MNLCNNKHYRQWLMRSVAGAQDKVPRVSSGVRNGDGVSSPLNKVA